MKTSDNKEEKKRENQQRKNIRNYKIEKFVEEHNGTIQTIILILVSLIGGGILLWGEPWNTNDNPKVFIHFFIMIVTLLLGVMTEIILLQVKDSTMQRKINSMGEIIRQQTKLTDVWNSETDLLPFFDNARSEFFISGMVIDKLIIKYLYKIDELLSKGIKVRIILETLDGVDESAKFLYGCDYNENESKKIIEKRIKFTLLYLYTLDNFKVHMDNKLLEIGLSNSPIINPSIIAYDYMNIEQLAVRRTKLEEAPEMSVRFYMQGADGNNSNPKKHPTLRINSNIMAEQYDDFVIVIENMWNSCEEFLTPEQIKEKIKNM